jgi:S1-C subfamily serine protease
MSLLLETSVNGHRLARGTGFVVFSAHGALLITNRHNVTGRDQTTGQPLSDTGGVPDTLVIAHHAEKDLGTWKVAEEALYEAEQPRWKEHPTFGSEADLVALPLTQLDGVDLYPYDLEDVPDIFVGPADTVSVIGFPFGRGAGGMFGIWATGFVASDPEIDYERLPLFLIDCRARPGQSGSPVIAYRSAGTPVRRISKNGTGMYRTDAWRLLGVYSGRINEQSDLGMVWKLSAIRELVASL